MKKIIKFVPVNFIDEIILRQRYPEQFQGNCMVQKDKVLALALWMQYC